MNESAKMARLLGRLKIEMNGAVVDSMSERGIVYPLSYGVSFPTIKTIVAEYAPDHRLALLLARQQVRELILASYLIADPDCVQYDETEMWAASVITVEAAEHIAAMFSASNISEKICADWLRSPNPLLQYSALLILARCLRAEAEWCLRYNEIQPLLEVALLSPERPVWNGFKTLSEVLCSEADGVAVVKQLMAFATDNNPALGSFLHQEMNWML